MRYSSLAFIVAIGVALPALAEELPIRPDNAVTPGIANSSPVRPEGATVDEVASVMGWQRHTVRGLFSGTLKKKLGLTLASATEERSRVYRIAAPEPA